MGGINWKFLFSRITLGALFVSLFIFLVSFPDSMGLFHNDKPQEFNELVVKQEVESQWSDWWLEGRKTNREWMACGYGYTSGDTVFVTDTEKVPAAKEVPGLTFTPADGCDEDRGVVANIHAHVAETGSGNIVVCEPSNGSDFWYLRTQPEPFGEFDVMIVVCAKHKYSYTFLPIEEVVIRYDWDQIGMEPPGRVKD